MFTKQFHKVGLKPKPKFIAVLFSGISLQHVSHSISVSLLTYLLFKHFLHYV